MCSCRELRKILCRLVVAVAEMLLAAVHTYH